MLLMMHMLLMRAVLRMRMRLMRAVRLMRVVVAYVALDRRGRRWRGGRHAGFFGAAGAASITVNKEDSG